MTFSFQQYVGDGATTLFNVPFPYLLQADITVKVNGVVTAYTWNTPTQVSVVPAPANSAIVEVRRNSNRSTLNVNFQDGSVLGKLDLNNDGTQLLYIAQEAFDAATSALQLASDAQYTAVGARIENVADPLSAQDAATKNYIDARVVAAGNVTPPGASVGSPSYWLKALTSTTWGWAQSVIADISDATAFGKSLLSSASAVALRGTLGLGSVAVENIGQGVEDDGSGNLRIKLDTASGPTGVLRSVNGLRVDPSLIRGFIDGFETGAPGGTNVLTIGPGSCVDSANASVITQATTYTKSLATWAVGTGNGALDTGVTGGSASTPYFVWAIMRPDTGVEDYLFSLSNSAPTMPANYTVKRLIGWFKTDGSKNIPQFQQRGDEFIFGVTVLDANAATIGVAASLKPLTVPLGFQVNALFHVQMSNASAGANLLITGPDETDQALSAGVKSISTQIASGNISGDFEKRTDTSGQIRLRGDTASNTVSIGTFGFRWARGRNS